MNIWSRHADVKFVFRKEYRKYEFFRDPQVNFTTNYLDIIFHRPYLHIYTPTYYIERTKCVDLIKKHICNQKTCVTYTESIKNTTCGDLINSRKLDPSYYDG